VYLNAATNTAVGPHFQHACVVAFLVAHVVQLHVIGQDGFDFVSHLFLGLSSPNEKRRPKHQRTAKDGNEDDLQNKGGPPREQQQQQQQHHHQEENENTRSATAMATTAVLPTSVLYPSNADSSTLALCHDTIRFVRFHFRNGGHLLIINNNNKKKNNNKNKKNQNNNKNHNIK